ncbi:Integrase core domain [Popillia japonica]|uniref:RNA-directed DNA polymerase n=1 Tax=Popillia japonica TaxID=7064 RepID=A0AAW1LTU5_POPJA
MNLTFEVDDLYKNITCQLDTGATCNVMGIENYRKITTIDKIRKSNIQLKYFGGKVIIPSGEAVLNCILNGKVYKLVFQLILNGKVYKLVFQLVEGDHVPLLSANACEKLQLIQVCKTINEVTEDGLQNERKKEQEIVKNYKDVFTGIGKLKKEVSLVVNEEIVTKVQNSKRIPIALRNDFKSTLNDLEQKGIIRKVDEGTPWTSNVVLVEKKDSKLRVCIDPLQLNRALRREPMEEAIGNHNQNIENLFKRLRTVGMTLNLNKTKLLQTEVSYYGHLLTSQSLQADPSKIRTIKKMAVPTNKKELQCFLGMSKWHWTSEDEGVFKALKDMITRAPTLKYFNADVFRCKRFDQYLCGQKEITVHIDHRPLITIFKKPILKASKRIQRMMLALQRYGLHIKYVPGAELHLANALSRSPEKMSRKTSSEAKVYRIEAFLKEIEEMDHTSTVSISNERLEEVREGTRKDETLRKVGLYVLDGWPEKRPADAELKQYVKYKKYIVMQGGILFKGNRVVVPRHLRIDMLKILHAGHSGMDASLKLARDTVFWPRINEQIRNCVSSCLACQEAQDKTKLPMQTHEVPAIPWQRISMDACEIEVENTKRKYLITVDHYFDFYEIDELKDLSAKTTVEICKRNVARHGIPETVITDNATQFVNDKFMNFTKKWQFKHVTSSPHYPMGKQRLQFRSQRIESRKH